MKYRKEPEAVTDSSNSKEIKIISKKLHRNGLRGKNQSLMVTYDLNLKEEGWSQLRIVHNALQDWQPVQGVSCDLPTSHPDSDGQAVQDGCIIDKGSLWILQHLKRFFYGQKLKTFLSFSPGVPIFWNVVGEYKVHLFSKQIYKV